MLARRRKLNESFSNRKTQHRFSIYTNPISSPLIELNSPQSIVIKVINGNRSSPEHVCMLIFESIFTSCDRRWLSRFEPLSVRKRSALSRRQGNISSVSSRGTRYKLERQAKEKGMEKFFNLELLYRCAKSFELWFIKEINLNVLRCAFMWRLGKVQAWICYCCDW